MNVVSGVVEHGAPGRMRHSAAALVRAGLLAIAHAGKQASVALRARVALKSSSRQMHVLETIALGARRQLLLVECEGQRYLVGAGPDQVGTILAIGSPKGEDGGEQFAGRENAQRSDAGGPS